MDEFFRFPHTPHLLWLGQGKPRGDKILSAIEAEALLRHRVVVEEKIDGANVGISVDANGNVRAQNRGHHLTRGTCHPQFKPLFRWIEERRLLLQDHLPRTTILFGEWCYAVHSVRYTELPDWFLAFDVYDRRERLFWNLERRTDLSHALGISLVPIVAEGSFQLADIPNLLGASRVTEGPAEGIYVKLAVGGAVDGRAKVVRPTFIQGIGEHWSERPMELNQLAPSAH